MSALLALALAIATPHTAARCDILNTDYVTRTMPRYHLRFVQLASAKDVVSDIGLHLFGADPRAELWYYPDKGSAPQVSLISTTNVTARNWHAEPDGGVRPHGSATLIALDAGGRIAAGALNAASPAPRSVIIPELGFVFKSLRLPYFPAAFVRRSCQSNATNSRRR